MIRDMLKIFEEFQLDVAKKNHHSRSTIARTGGNICRPTHYQTVRSSFSNKHSGMQNRNSSFITPEDLLIALFSATTTSAYLKAQGLEKRKAEQRPRKHRHMKAANQHLKSMG